MLTTTEFGTTQDGQTVQAFHLTNSNNVSVVILSLGATIQQWRLPDGCDIVLGFDTLADYLQDQAYLGRTVGRYANRIENGQFTLNEIQHNVSTNLQGNSLHGGVNGFHNRIWTLSDSDNSHTPSITLTLVSEDGDQGFPGTLTVDVCFSLNNDNCLHIAYSASCDQDTVFNPTQHSYFNLAGHDSGNVNGHQIQVFASHYTPANSGGIPTGELKSVTQTPFDLRHPIAIGLANSQQDPEIQSTQGLDHNFCLDEFDPKQQTMTVAAIVTEPNSGRKLITCTSMPGVQIYTANFLGGHPLGKGGKAYSQYQGFCVESQFYPNSPNQHNFPSPVVRKGHSFRSMTSYQVMF